MKKWLLVIIAVIMVVSCKTTYNIQLYKYVSEVEENEDGELIAKNTASKSIRVENDSLLTYVMRLGGFIGNSTTIKYTTENGTLIVDSLSIDGRYDPEISNMRFMYTPDSLFNILNNESYYEQKFEGKQMKRINRESKRQFRKDTHMSYRKFKKEMENK